MAWMACTTRWEQVRYRVFCFLCAFFFRAGGMQDPDPVMYSKTLRVLRPIPARCTEKDLKESGDPSEVPRLFHFLAGVFDHGFT